MNGDEFFEYDNDGPGYRPREDIDSSEIPTALKTLVFFDDETYLRMQAFNLAMVDQFLMELEYKVLHDLIDQERTPPEAMFLNAQSQMWIFAAYEILRTWKQRAKDIKKWHENGALENKRDQYAAIENNLSPSHEIRTRQIERVLEDSALIDRISSDLRRIHMPFVRLEAIRIILAKHETRRKRNAFPTAPGYGRINPHCGSLDYQIEIGRVILDDVSRRDIADDIRALSINTHAPTESEIKSFDEYMSGKGLENLPESFGLGNEDF